MLTSRWLPRAGRAAHCVQRGEAVHHDHHAFPRSARHGLRWYEIDPTAWAVRGLRAAKLAWNVVEVSPERQRQRMPISELSPTMKR